MITSNLPVAIFLIPFFGSLLAVMCAIFNRLVSRAIAYLSLTGMVILSVMGLINVFAAGAPNMVTPMGRWAPPLGIAWTMDPFAAFMAVVVSVTSLIILVAGLPAIQREFGSKETYFWGTALLFVGGLIGMVMTNDLFNMFVFLEVASISSYAMVATGGKGSPRAAMKYLLIGSIGASGYLLGVGFIYAATGSLNMPDIYNIVTGNSPWDVPNPNLMFMGIFLVITGFAVKMGMFPFHMWMPAAYAKSSTICAALMAPLATKVAAYAMIRVMFWVYGVAELKLNYNFLMEFLIFSGGLAMIFGGFAALLQKDLRRLLAYSSISQMGLVGIGIGIANQTAMSGAIIHLANDALMKGAFFMLAGGILFKYGIKHVNDLNILRGRSILSVAIIMITTLSLAGIPPLCGFWGKWYVLAGAAEAGHWPAIAMIILGSLGSVAYVFRIWERMLFTAPAQPSEDLKPQPGSTLMIGGAGVFTIGIVVLGFTAYPVMQFIINRALPVGVGV